MSLDRETILNVAHLARIRFSGEKLDSIAVELSMIIKWVEQLAEVNTDKVKPMSNVTNTILPQRSDDVMDGGYSQDIIKNAPEHVDDYFTVPKVVE